MVYQIMFYGGLILAIISIIVAMVLFFRLNIRKVVGDLTGYNAKHDIRLIRENGIENDPKKNKIKDMTTKLLVKEQNTTATIKRDYITSKNKKSDASDEKIKLMQDLEADKKKQEYAKKKAQETFKGNGVYRSGAIKDSMLGETQIIRDTSVPSKDSGFTVIEEATSLLNEEIGTNILISDEEREMLLDSQNKETYTDVLYVEDEITDVLFNEEGTSVLSDESTDILSDEADTGILSDSSTDVLMNEEDTSVLLSYETDVLMGEDDTTDVLMSGEDTSVLSENVTDGLTYDEGTTILSDDVTDVLINEDDTSVLFEDDTSILHNDVFTSLEDTVVHHTSETMK